MDLCPSWQMNDTKTGISGFEFHLSCETEAHPQIMSLDKYLCNCNCNLPPRIIRKTFFMYVMFLWVTVCNLGASHAKEESESVGE